MLRREGKLEKMQPKASETTGKFLQSCHMEVAMKNKVKWELNPERVAGHFLTCLGGVVAPHAVKLPEEPITGWASVAVSWGEMGLTLSGYLCLW